MRRLDPHVTDQPDTKLSRPKTIRVGRTQHLYEKGYLKLRDTE